MAREKLKKQDLKLKEDEFLTFSLKAQEWFKENYKNLIFVIVGAAVIVAGISFIKAKKVNVAAENNYNFAIAQSSVFNYPYMIGEQAAAQRAQIVSQADSNIETLIDKSQGKPLGRSASYLKAMLLFEQGEYDRAITAATGYVDVAVTNEERTRGNLLIGYCYESKVYDKLIEGGEDIQTIAGWRDQALNYFKAATESGKGTYLEYEALLSQARIYDLQTDVDQSMEILKRVKDEKGWFDDYIKVVTDYPEGVSGMALLETIERSNRQTTYAAVADLYIKRLESLQQ